jgi:PAS domain-containing protein
LAVRKKVMKIICAWCQKALTEDRNPKAEVSHGICPDCMENLFGPSRMILSEFLNSIEVPVLVMDENRGIRQANRAAERALVNVGRQVQGKRFGIVIECAHASVMGECGLSPYCSGCAFRRNVYDTYRDGKPRYGEYSQHKVATAKGPAARQFRYSTSKAGESVVVAIEGVKDLPVES